MRQDTTKGDCGADECVQLFVTANGELQMARCDTLDFEIFRCVAGKFQDFGGQVLENGSHVNGG